jgi:hypothetical protein
VEVIILRIEDIFVTKDKVKFECPQCYWMFNAERPNGFHPVASISKPKENSLDGSVIEELHDYRNPKCRESFSIYWFEPKRFFDRA